MAAPRPASLLQGGGSGRLFDTPGVDAPGEMVHLAAGGDVGEPDFVGEGGDELVPLLRKDGGGAAVLGGKI